MLSRPLTLGTRCVIFNSARDILLVKHTYIPGWHLPGGSVAPGESIQKSLIREINEETGILIGSKISLVGVFITFWCQSATMWCCLCVQIFEKSGEKINSLEIESAQFFPINKLPENIDHLTVDWISLATEYHKNHLRR